MSPEEFVKAQERLKRKLQESGKESGKGNNHTYTDTKDPAPLLEEEDKTNKSSTNANHQSRKRKQVSSSSSRKQKRQKTDVVEGNSTHSPDPVVTTNIRKISPEDHDAKLVRKPEGEELQKRDVNTKDTAIEEDKKGEESDETKEEKYSKKNSSSKHKHKHKHKHYHHRHKKSSSSSKKGKHSPGAEEEEEDKDKSPQTNKHSKNHPPIGNTAEEDRTWGGDPHNLDRDQDNDRDHRTNRHRTATKEHDRVDRERERNRDRDRNRNDHRDRDRLPRVYAPIVTGRDYTSRVCNPKQRPLFLPNPY